MARKQVVLYQITDSLTGKELPEKEARRVSLMVDSDRWYLDLGAASYEKLQAALAPFVANESKVRGSAREAGVRQRKVTPAPVLSAEERTAVASFAATKGLQPVASRGRVRQATVDSWVEAGRPGL